VNVLSKLSEGGDLGKEIATAFVATLFGVGSANIIFLPIGGKLKAKSEAETALRRMMLEGILAIQGGDNPRIVRDKLEGFLTPKERGAAEAAEAVGAAAPARA